jgi:N,N'-diacetyllegionaminate synthase
MRSIEIGDRRIGDGEPAYVIAEAGLNHDGDVIQAKQLIEAAARAGADAVKFQVFRTEELCSKKSEHFSLFESLELSADDWGELAAVAADCKIPFFASVFGNDSADILERIHVPAYKIASGDLTYWSLLQYVAKKRRPVILSTGMATIGEIDDALRQIYKTGNREVVLLHCVSAYPPSFSDLNLRAIQALKTTFHVPVGFSDHTLRSIASVAAVATGANLIEKHFTLDTNRPGPDHKLSLGPNDFAAMIQDIRLVERSLGDGFKIATPVEEDVKKFARRSVTAKVEIPKGSIITADSIQILRPADGIEPRFADLVIGRTAKRTIGQGVGINWNDI